MTNTVRLFLYAVTALLITACDKRQETAVDKEAPIYPDYTNIAVPVNIAPLNFLVRDPLAKDVRVFADGELLAESSSNAVTIDIDDWKELLARNAGKQIKVTVKVGYDDRWTAYRPFTWTVVADSIDSHITYRLIEPDYEVFGQLQIEERCVENFDTRALSHCNVVGRRCMNCHISGGGRPDLTAMYVRGKGGGMILNKDGEIKKLNLQGNGNPSVYFAFSPSGRYMAFSTNKIIPAFHAIPKKRLEVFDTMSDIFVTDLHTGKVYSSPLLSDTTRLETFPTISPDGKYLYYCTAPALTNPSEIRTLRYSLCRIAFNDATGAIGTKADTVVNARITGTSVCHPRISPDGKYLVYTVADYGTFPIWHPETDLWMLNLETMQTKPLTAANSDKSDTYHSWSHNSRWLCFASKRDDGLYGKPYFCYIDRNGQPHKPFVLPQENPHFYDNCLKSFNIPELINGKVTFGIGDVEKEIKPIE